MNNRSQARTIMDMTRAIKLKAVRLYILGGGFPETKNEGSYFRQMWRLIRDLYNGNLNEFEFIDDYKELVSTQFEKAWLEGARRVSTGPRFLTPEELIPMDNRINEEVLNSLHLVDDILKARQEGTDVATFRTRAEMFSARYNDVRNESMISNGGSDINLRWQVGPTEHCTDCANLSGTVATADSWAASGWKPQSRNLECGGWRCQCEMVVTSEPITEGGIPI